MGENENQNGTDKGENASAKKMKKRNGRHAQKEGEICSTLSFQSDAHIRGPDTRLLYRGISESAPSLERETPMVAESETRHQTRPPLSRHSRDSRPLALSLKQTKIRLSLSLEKKKKKKKKKPFLRGT